MGRVKKPVERTSESETPHTVNPASSSRHETARKSNSVPGSVARQPQAEKGKSVWKPKTTPSASNPPSILQRPSQAETISSNRHLGLRVEVASSKGSLPVKPSGGVPRVEAAPFVSKGVHHTRSSNSMASRSQGFARQQAVVPKSVETDKTKQSHSQETPGHPFGEIVNQFTEAINAMRESNMQMLFEMQQTQKASTDNMLAGMEYVVTAVTQPHQLPHPLESAFDDAKTNSSSGKSSLKSTPSMDEFEEFIQVAALPELLGSQPAMPLLAFSVRLEDVPHHILVKDIENFGPTFETVPQNCSLSIQKFFPNYTVQGITRFVLIGNNGVGYYVHISDEVVRQHATQELNYKGFLLKPVDHSFDAAIRMQQKLHNSQTLFLNTMTEYALLQYELTGYERPTAVNSSEISTLNHIELPLVLDQFLRQKALSNAINTQLLVEPGTDSMVRNGTWAKEAQALHFRYKEDFLRTESHKIREQQYGIPNPDRATIYEMLWMPNILETPEAQPKPNCSRCGRRHVDMLLRKGRAYATMKGCGSTPHLTDVFLCQACTTLPNDTNTYVRATHTERFFALDSQLLSSVGQFTDVAFFSFNPCDSPKRVLINANVNQSYSAYKPHPDYEDVKQYNGNLSVWRAPQSNVPSVTPAHESNEPVASGSEKVQVIIYSSDCQKLEMLRPTGAEFRQVVAVLALDLLNAVTGDCKVSASSVRYQLHQPLDVSPWGPTLQQHLQKLAERRASTYVALVVQPHASRNALPEVCVPVATVPANGDRLNTALLAAKRQAGCKFKTLKLLQAEHLPPATTNFVYTQSLSKRSHRFKRGRRNEYTSDSDSKSGSHSDSDSNDDWNFNLRFGLSDYHRTLDHVSKKAAAYFVTDGVRNSKRRINSSKKDPRAFETLVDILKLQETIWSTDPLLSMSTHQPEILRKLNLSVAQLYHTFLQNVTDHNLLSRINNMTHDRKLELLPSRLAMKRFLVDESTTVEQARQYTAGILNSPKEYYFEKLADTFETIERTLPMVLELYPDLVGAEHGFTEFLNGHEKTKVYWIHRHLQPEIQNFINTKMRANANIDNKLANVTLQWLKEECISYHDERSLRGNKEKEPKAVARLNIIEAPTTLDLSVAQGYLKALMDTELGIENLQHAVTAKGELLDENTSEYQQIATLAHKVFNKPSYRKRIPKAVDKAIAPARKFLQTVHQANKMVCWNEECRGPHPVSQCPKLQGKPEEVQKILDQHRRKTHEATKGIIAALENQETSESCQSKGEETSESDQEGSS